MSEIVKTEAVVLKAIKYRDTSKIVTFFSKEHGKLSAILKGARSSKTMYGNALEPMSHVALVLYEKKGRDIQTLTQCEPVHAYRHLFEDFDKMGIGMAVIELIRDIAHEQEKNVPLFHLLTETLNALNSASRNYLNLFFYFEIRMLDILGFSPSFGQCIECGEDIFPAGSVVKKVDFHLEKGGPLCQECRNASGLKVSISVQSLKVLDHLFSEKDIKKITNLKIENGTGLEIESLLFAYLRHHVSGVKALKTRKMFRGMNSLPS